MSESKLSWRERLLGKFDPSKASDRAAIEAIVESYERAVQLDGIPNNERQFIQQTQQVATSMIAYLNPKKQPQNYLKFVYFREQYMMYQNFLHIRHRIRRNPKLTAIEQAKLIETNWQSILHMRSDLITNAQVILTLTFDIVKPVIPVLNKPMPVFFNGSGQELPRGNDGSQPKRID